MCPEVCSLEWRSWSKKSHGFCCFFAFSRHNGTTPCTTVCLRMWHSTSCRAAWFQQLGLLCWFWVVWELIQECCRMISSVHNCWVCFPWLDLLNFRVEGIFKFFSSRLGSFCEFECSWEKVHGSKGRDEFFWVRFLFCAERDGWF